MTSVITVWDQFVPVSEPGPRRPWSAPARGTEQNWERDHPVLMWKRLPEPCNHKPALRETALTTAWAPHPCRRVRLPGGQA